jgi:glycosyltransferase involved in cell wall biosynthesis
MKVSVVVPAYNEAKLIGRALESIRTAAGAFGGRGWETELIVCDNNSNDNTAAIARERGATVVFEPVNQISRARNRGGQCATGDWLIFIDADSYPSVGLFDEVAREMELGRCAGGGVLVRLEGARGLVWVMNGVWNVISRLTRWAAGSFIFCEAELFRELGGFSEELYASEEIEFSRRLKRLARRRGKRVKILMGYPLVTSARKGELCSPMEYARLLAATVLRRGKNLRRREDCGIWYDGRR